MTMGVFRPELVRQQAKEVVGVLHDVCPRKFCVTVLIREGDESPSFAFLTVELRDNPVPHLATIEASVLVFIKISREMGLLLFKPAIVALLRACDTFKMVHILL